MIQNDHYPTGTHIQEKGSHSDRENTHDDMFSQAVKPSSKMDVAGTM